MEKVKEFGEKFQSEILKFSSVNYFEDLFYSEFYKDNYKDYRLKNWFNNRTFEASSRIVNCFNGIIDRSFSNKYLYTLQMLRKRVPDFSKFLDFSSHACFIFDSMGIVDFEVRPVVVSNINKNGSIWTKYNYMHGFSFSVSDGTEIDKVISQFLNFTYNYPQFGFLSVVPEKELKSGKFYYFFDGFSYDYILGSGIGIPSVPVFSLSFDSKTCYFTDENGKSVSVFDLFSKFVSDEIGSSGYLYKSRFFIDKDLFYNKFIHYSLSLGLKIVT